MHENYFKAAVPEPYRIFGLRLLPLSLGRYRLLKRFDCGFVADEERSASMDDLLVGALICSMRVKEFLEFLESENREGDVKLWDERIRREMAADPYFNLLAKIGLFRAYIEESCNVPKYWDETSDTNISGAHWSHSIEVGLRSELGYTEEEINEGPLAKALLDYFKHAENQGLIRLMGEGEEEHGPANAALLEQLVKGGLCPASN